MIAVVEGIDASGKKLQARKLFDVFDSDSRFMDVKTFDFPHYQSLAGGLVGRILRGDVLVNTEQEVMEPENVRNVSENASLSRMREAWSLDKGYVIQSVMLADRCEHSELLREFSGKPHNLLILDRYYMSGIVYGQADGLDKQWLENVHSVLPKADLFFLIDISVNESVRRRPERLDYYEKNYAKLQTVREKYLEEFRHRKYHVINGEQHPDIITSLIASVIRSYQESIS